MKLPWSKIINVTTDGSPNLTGKNVGLLRRIQNKVKDENPDQDVIFLHCIIHQESLCKSVLQLNHVVNPVVKLVNFIRARGLQHRQFITFLEETDADHQDLLYHSRVRWLSLGKVFQRVWELKEEIGAFLELLRKAGEFPELSNKSWLCDFAFAVDIFSHMNELNVKLQGKDQFVHDMYTNVKAFKSKLAFFSRQISNKLFTHFPTLATTDVAVLSQPCSTDLKQQEIKWHALYLPREFSIIILMVVYIPLPANVRQALEVIGRDKTVHSAVFPIIAGDFNQVSLKKSLNNYQQHITYGTRGANTHDYCNGTIKNAYGAIQCPHFGKSDHLAVLLLPACRQRSKTAVSMVKTKKVWPRKIEEHLQD
ncbi:general transcription factor II-I repeat domain-containing protein 2-like [Hypanus sabinus]|uniref:general transcription factor II-I repeat domain-containing protein 2-like n=1 Tax=Hypanus sabinus TaxID=79690 RepID=UPI0028C48120|nr:general transcription factor II-I repeat domain-containing protein 2-like [Hypanus sabinus]